MAIEPGLTLLHYRIVAQISDIDGTHIWVMSVGREGMQRLTTEGRNVSPIWSPDGKYLCFQSDETGRWDVHVVLNWVDRVEARLRSDGGS